MTSELRELYQQVILDHASRPRNHRELEHATHQSEGYNPLCGDHITVFCTAEGETITDASFTGSGCAICTASSSMMTEFLKGKTVEHVQDVFTKFRDLVTGRVEAMDVIDDLDKLAVFAGVREFPIRVKCATLAWHTMKAALENRDEVVSTE